MLPIAHPQTQFIFIHTPSSSTASCHQYYNLINPTLHSHPHQARFNTCPHQLPTKAMLHALSSLAVLLLSQASAIGDTNSRCSWPTDLYRTCSATYMLPSVVLYPRSRTNFPDAGNGNLIDTFWWTYNRFPERRLIIGACRISKKQGDDITVMPSLSG
ncbi:hypothetical protein K469DRAFT_161755 [Zopfia rhizophila CBS 207.26]|uniref:Uncharacterized protein n=1 Tax=Zopfia rhizophila CBS 207.26 TaxID=1314779 RepID=A0A6A6E3G7_9PEZI|nr:hypothetical protein K469DRAFT_161755 [Zopfia rhizophila CBS 207.26]